MPELTSCHPAKPWRSRTIVLYLLTILPLACGPTAAPQIQLTTQIVVDAGVEEEVKEEVDAPIEPTAVVPPEPVTLPHFVMKGTSLDGPFRSTKQACKWLKKNFIGECIKGKNDWHKGKTLGERGGILGARTQLVKLHKEKAKSMEDSCAVLLKTSRGWWLRDHREVCQNNNDLGGDGFYTSLKHMEYADGLSFGVLTIERNGNREAKRIEMLDGKEIETTWWVDQTELMFCAVNSDGEPQCSEWHVTNCHFNERYIGYSNGVISVEDGQSDSDVCFDRVVKPGTYSLFEPGFHKPQGSIEARDMGGEEDPLKPIPMFGPFSSVKAYCKSLPHGYYEDEGYSHESSGTPEPPPKCLLKQKGWSRVQPRGSKGAIMAARLLRVSSDMAGAPIEYCHVAIRTKDGWFMSSDSYHCQGVMGPSTDADIVSIKTRWVGTSDSPALAILFDVSLQHEDHGGYEYELDYQLESQGSPKERPSKKASSKKASSNKVPYESPGRVAHVMFCGLGSTGIPSCTGNIPLGCPYDHGNKVYKAWSYDGAKLNLKGSEELMESCEAYSEIQFGEHELTFP